MGWLFGSLSGRFSPDPDQDGRESEELVGRGDKTGMRLRVVHVATDRATNMIAS